jgi:MYXO-CTERM domain-containing protein
VPIHAALLPGGNVLYWDRHDYPTDARPQIWDGVTSTASHNMPVRPDGEHYDLFCAGHAFAADGSLFVAGGHIADNYGEPWASRFDPAEQHWTALAPMQAGRWYPTVAILPTGDLVVASGAINPFVTNDLPEVYDVRANRWRPLTGARRPLPFYPFLFTTPRGLFAGGSMIDTGFLDTAAPGRWIPVDQTLAGRDPFSAIGRDYGTAVLTDAERGRIFVIGGTTHPASGDHTQRTTEWIDLSETLPRWRAGPTMTFARRMHVGTLLPDGSVLVTGGTTSDAFSRADGAILNPELLTGLEDSWQPMACASEARVYHSVAVLLPDARVLVAGGGHPGETDHPTGEIFSPPYLHRGTQLAAPVIAAGPGVAIGADGIARVRYGATIAFATPDPSRVAAVHWLRPAAVTHAFNQDQRIVRLAAGDGGIGSRAIAPGDPRVAPPGPYMMFLIDDHGVPSHAAWLRTNLPPEASDDLIEIIEGQPVPDILERVVANDVDVERDPIAVTVVDPPHAGAIVGGTYVPNPGFSGEDSFTYTLSDGLDTSRIAVATIRIARVDGIGCAVGSARSSAWLALVVAALAVRRRRSQPRGPSVSCTSV